MSRTIIHLPSDYNVRLNFDFLQRSPKELLHRVENDTVVKLFRQDDQMILTRIAPEQKSLAITILNTTATTKQRNAITNFVSDWFDVHTDLIPFYNLAAKDPLMKNLVKQFYGYRIIGQPDLFESLSWAIIGQQINLSFAYTLKQRLVETYGDHLIFDDQKYFLFPNAEVIAALDDSQLLALQFSRQKATYLKEIARAFAGGELSKEAIKKLSFEEAKDYLMKLKGIGNWTANYALMKCFRFPNAFPLEDAGLHNAIKNLKGMSSKPSLDQVRRLFKKFKGWEAYATLYFWKSLG